MTQSDDEIEHQKHSEKRRELIENCKHIRSIFEAEFHPHDDVETSSYLDMNGSGMNRNQRTPAIDENENGSSKCFIHFNEVFICETLFRSIKGRIHQHEPTKSSDRECLRYL